MMFLSRRPPILSFLTTTALFIRPLSAMSATSGKAILVTGANRGIGLAICNEIVQHESFSEDDIVYLGSRSFGRGLEAVQRGIVEEKQDRVKVVQLDVTDELSVQHCREVIESELEDSNMEFYGLVNNAGGYFGKDRKACLDINIFGMKRVSEEFLPMMKKDSRIVNIGSAGGPNYVARQSESVKKFLTKKDITWKECEDYIEECLSEEVEDGNEWSASYGLSKAMVNCYTMILAAQNPDIVINSCTPGYILTDLTRGAAEKAGKTPEEMGMKDTAAGAKSPVHCLFGNVGQGWYYGSDCKRSPIDKYRGPGEPEYTEETEVVEKVVNN